MKYSGFCAGFIRPSLGLKRVFGVFLFITSLIGAGLFAAESQTNRSDEVRRMIKQARKLTRAGSIPGAEVILRRAVELDSGRSDAKVELAFVLTKQRKLLEAYKVVYAVAEVEPKNARAFAVLGSVLLTAGRFIEARAIFFTALKLKRDEGLAWAGFGMLDFYENRIDESLSNLQEAVYHQPDEPDFWFALAQVSARAEKYREAAEAYNRFLSISSSTDADRRARIKGLIEFLNFIGHKEGLYYSSGAEKTAIGFDLVGNRPIIKLRINGGEPLRFVLDTGSGITVISDDTAKRLKIKAITHGGFARGIGGDGKFEIVYGFLRNIQIGEVTVRNIPVYIRKFHSDQQDVDGYIGLALISKFLATIDYGSKTFTLFKKDDDHSVDRDTALSLPLRLTSSGFLSGEVQLEGIPTMLNFIVDTGASVSVISDLVASNSAISPFANQERLRVIGSAGVTDDVPTFMLPMVTFGQHSRKQIVAIALDLDIINEASGFEQAGILGGNFLKNYRLTFDFKNSKVLFTSINPEK